MEREGERERERDRDTEREGRERERGKKRGKEAEREKNYHAYGLYARSLVCKTLSLASQPSLCYRFQKSILKPKRER